MEAHSARLTIDQPLPGSRTSLTAAGRKVVSTGRTIWPAAKSGAARVCGSERPRAAAWCNRFESSSSAGTIRTGSGATTTTSCGSSLGLGVSVECIGAPYSVQCHPPEGGRGIALLETSCPTLHPGLTKARRYDGEYGAA